jgi:hypothetical protein
MFSSLFFSSVVNAVTSDRAVGNVIAVVVLFVWWVWLLLV